jgi:hypothetical protein
MRVLMEVLASYLQNNVLLYYLCKHITAELGHSVRKCVEYLSRDSIVGIATGYELDGPGIESWWGERFSAPVQTSPGAYPASCTMGSGSFPVVRWPGRGVNHPPPSITGVKERVELYLYSPPGPLWPVLGSTLPLPVLYECCSNRGV